MSDADLDAAARLFSGAQTIAVFTGAGVSRESGIPTFRDDGGLWSKYPIDRFATPAGLAEVAVREPQMLAQFFRDILAPVAAAAPNPAHQAIADLERGPFDVGIATQNVDGLHQSAGSSEVHEVHGSFFEVTSALGKTLRRVERADLARIVARLEKERRGPFAALHVARALKPILGVNRRALAHRPNIVLFGEAMAEPAWSRAQSLAQSCDVMLVVGTSGEVYPAALLPESARANGAKIIGVGPERGSADVWLEGPAGILLPPLVERVLERAK